MNRKQFIVLIAVLVGLALAGAGVMWWQKSAWRTNNGAVGERLLPGLVVSEVEKIRVVEAGESVTMNRVEGKWQVAERNGYPANLDRIADFLAKLAEQDAKRSSELSKSLRSFASIIKKPT